MADYKVRVKTDSGYIRECIVRDFVYSADAERAALSQTGGGQIWSVSPHFDKPEPVSMFDESSYIQHPQNNIEWDTSDWWDDKGELTSEGKLSQFVIFTIIPTLVCIAIHPIAVILWNVGFSKLWFGWKFWFE
jgi:hypothetical protein